MVIYRNEIFPRSKLGMESKLRLFVPKQKAVESDRNVIIITWLLGHAPVIFDLWIEIRITMPKSYWTGRKSIRSAARIVGRVTLCKLGLHDQRSCNGYLLMKDRREFDGSN